MKNTAQHIKDRKAALLNEYTEFKSNSLNQRAESDARNRTAQMWQIAGFCCGVYQLVRYFLLPYLGVI